VYSYTRTPDSNIHSHFLMETILLNTYQSLKTEGLDWKQTYMWTPVSVQNRV